MKSSIKRDARDKLDSRLQPLQPLEKSLVPPAKGWVRAIRDALGMSGTQFASRLGFSWQSMDDLEKSEVAGTIQLQTLRKAARELDCTLVYALVPKTSLAEAVDSRARRIPLRNLVRVSQTMALEDQSVADSDTEVQIDAYIRDHVRDKDIWDER